MVEKLGMGGYCQMYIVEKFCSLGGHICRLWMGMLIL